MCQKPVSQHPGLATSLHISPGQCLACKAPGNELGPAPGMHYRMIVYIVWAWLLASSGVLILCANLAKSLLCTSQSSQELPKCADFVLAPPGSAKNEIEQFSHMEMVDMIITRIWLSGRKSRSVNICFQQLDFGPKWDSTPRGDRPDKTNPRPGANLSFLPAGYCYAIQSKLP